MTRPANPPAPMEPLRPCPLYGKPGYQNCHCPVCLDEDIYPNRRAAPSPSDGEVARLRAELAILAAVSADAHSVEVLMKSAAALSRQSAELAEARAVAEDAELKVGEHAERYQAMLAALTALGCRVRNGRWEIRDYHCKTCDLLLSEHKSLHTHGFRFGQPEFVPIPGAGAKEGDK